MLKIGELAERSGFTTKTIRFYEEIGLLRNVHRDPNGYRNYEDDCLSKLEFIRNGRVAGLSLAEIGRILELRMMGVAPCDHVLELLEQRLVAIGNQIDVLMRARSEVNALVELARQFRRDECDKSDICSIIARR